MTDRARSAGIIAPRGRIGSARDMDGPGWMVTILGISLVAVLIMMWLMGVATGG